MPRFSLPVHASLSADIMPQAAPSHDGHRRTRAWLAWAAVAASTFLPFCRHSDTGRRAWDSEWVWEIWVGLAQIPVAAKATNEGNREGKEAARKRKKFLPLLVV